MSPVAKPGSLLGVNEPGSAGAVSSRLLSYRYYDAIREEVSGNRPFADFAEIARFSGFAPSAGADQAADYLRAKAIEIGLSNVRVERFAANLPSYTWAFRNEPYWEGKRAVLRTVGSTAETIADFAIHKVHLARFSRSASVTAELVDVGMGVDTTDYSQSVAGKVVLATGPASLVMRRAVWERGALGVVVYRAQKGIDGPDQIMVEQLVPWSGPNGEDPTFAFSISFRRGADLSSKLRQGDKITVNVEIDAETREGAYPVVLAEIPGFEPELPYVLVCAHSNARNTGGANNLTGVGCTLEVARVLAQLIKNNIIPQPRRSIRFIWGAEHYGTMSYYHRYPDEVGRVLAMINVDMIGYDQERTGAMLHLYRSPHSSVSFLDDIIEVFLEQIGDDNSISLRHMNFLAGSGDGFRRPLFADGGSRSQFRYMIEPFWGPSDHEDVLALGIRSVMLNDFPVSTLGTQEDTVSAGDPTQMRRGALLSAASAYFLAVASIDKVEALLNNASSRALIRLVRERARALDLVNASGTGDLPNALRQAANVINQAYRREEKAIDSISELVGNSPEAIALRERINAELKVFSIRGLELIASYQARDDGDQRPDAGSALISESSCDRYDRIPVRVAEICGPVNLYRFEYGRWWLQDQCGDENFLNKLRLARRGAYVGFEALNFADGLRSIKQIADLLSAEFTQVPENEVEEFFGFLERCGIVSFIDASLIEDRVGDPRGNLINNE